MTRGGGLPSVAPSIQWTRVLAPLPRQGEAISNRNQCGRHPLVRMDALVQLADRCRGHRAVARVRDAAAPEDVVERKDTTRSDEGEAVLVVGEVAFLVGVDECQVEGAGLAGRLQLG